MKRGSALLIVLGLLAFLVVSAVAFSAYMRTSRLPSSYLLRMSSSRNLVKAALAESLDEIDRAIANNPHPGVGIVASTDGTGNPVFNRNQWRERVFLGTNSLLNVDQTVSTLTLEGLAYVPAPLINEVRYYSRRSPAAAWHELGFDAGRFAFTAIDVSDYFDVNRAMAAPEGGGRTSADNARVSLAYLFEGTSHTDWRTQPTAWDAFMDNFVADDAASKVPLVSWADLNLAIWDKKPAGVLSPWCRFVEGGTEFVQDDPTERLTLSNMVFVTDSLYPPAKTTKPIVDLASSANQPFGAALKMKDESGYSKRGVEMILQNVNKPANLSWTDTLVPPELVQLADYLDVDSVPSSLALPTVERTPMVTGVSIGIDAMHVEVKSDDYETDKVASDGVSYYYQVNTYTVQLTAGNCFANVGLAYPFKHNREAKGKWNVQAYATLTFVKSDADNLRLPSAKEWALTPDWSASEKSIGVGKFTASNPDSLPSGFVLCSEKKSVSEPTAGGDDAAYLDDQQLEFGEFKQQTLATELGETYNDITGLHKDTCTLRVMQKMKQNPPANGVTPPPEKIGEPVLQFGALPAGDDLGSAETPAANATFIPTIQVWARVTDAETAAPVDLVPACFEDDLKPCDIVGEAKGSQGRPALRFTDGSGTASVAYDYGNKKLSGAGDVKVAPLAYMTDDPRFNYAPENFWKLENGYSGEFKSLWKTKTETTAGNRDGDIFMTTSDAGYLQSWYELAFLTPIATSDTDDWGCLSGSGYNGKARNSNETLAADAAMWRTFTPYGPNRDAIFDDGENVISGASGMRVCPYTPDPAVMMGALANTPRDWWAASTNDVGTVKQKMLGSIDEALKYTFSDHSTDASSKIKWADMEKLANRFIAWFHASQSVDGWKTIYNALDWDGALFDDIENGSNVTLDSVDRKFLYGFWRDCFAARQQLFLVFVRAEPMMMGGGGIGQMPPMLGARAVALVWRSPTKTGNQTNQGFVPHQMRVLFYRQFD